MLKGDQVRSFNQIRHLSKDHDVSLLALSTKEIDPEDREKVAKYCSVIEVVHTSKWKSLIRAAIRFIIYGDSLNESYFSSPSVTQSLRAIVDRANPDVVHAQLIRMAEYVSSLTGVITSIDFIDALSLNLERRAEQASMLTSWLWTVERRRVRILEREALRKFQAAFVTSRVDHDHLCENKPSASEKLTIIPNGVDLDHFAFGGQEERSQNTLLFTGNMSYKPNIEAVEYFTDCVFGDIRDQRGEVEFKIAGANPTRNVQTLEREEGVSVLGFVPSIAQILREATIAVCPLQSGAGIQNKVLEAMATGTPVVATSLAVAGVEGAQAGTHFLRADTESEFVDATLKLLDDEALRIELATAARKLIESKYDWSSTVACMDEELREVTRF